MSKNKVFKFIKSFEGKWSATEIFDNGTVFKKCALINIDEQNDNIIKFKELTTYNIAQSIGEFSIIYDPKADTISRKWEHCLIPLKVEISEGNYVKVFGGYELWENSNTITYKFCNPGAFYATHLVEGREQNYNSETTFIKEEVSLSGVETLSY